MQKETTIAFIGGGNMTKSLISGLIESGFNKKALWVSDCNPEKLTALYDQFGVGTGISNSKMAQMANILVLAVKAHDIPALLAELKEVLNTKKLLIISLVPGLPTIYLETVLGSPAAIVRAVPNTPTLLHAGATGLYANTHVSAEQKNLAESLLRSVGITVWINHEHEIDAITALLELGPGYFLFMMKSLQEAAETLGLSKATARLLTLQASLGVTKMTMESDLPFKEIIKGIASQSDISKEAFPRLESGNIKTLLNDVLLAAKERSIELSHPFNPNKE